MRILSPEFMNKNISTEREPIIVVKIINDNKNIYLTSHPVTIVDAGSSQFQGCIVSATGSSQSIVPERGFSTIGDMSITLQDVDGAFTAELRSILNNFSDTINNNKSEFYTGLGDMLFQDYVKITPVWVSGIANSDLEYTLTFSDTQRLTKASLFKTPAKTELVNSPLFATENISLEVVSTADFNDVLHDDNWEYAPGKRVGYVKVTGVTESGESAKEIMQWEGKTTTHLQNIKRQLFDTPLVNLNGEDKVEIEEVIYLDLSVPKMIIALLTGDLYGQAGEGIPDSWNSGVSANLIDIDSYENIGQDLWEQQVAFVDIDKQTAKEFIASQLLAPYGLFNYINQNGELQLRRFGFQSQDSSSDIVLSYESLTSVSNISRDFKKIRNNFLINWEWRPDKDFYARKDGYIDVVSQEKFNIKSDTYEIKLRGLKNRSKGSKPTLDYVAQGIATRFSNPSINITAEGLMRDMIAIEVGDTVTIDLPNQPDYASADSLLASFEVQGMSWDFLQGTQSLKLFTSSGAPSEFGITSGSSISNIGHAGWTSLIGSGYGSVNGEGEFVFNSTSTIPTGKYYFDGDVKFPDSSITTISKDFFLDASTIRMGVSAVINGVGTGGTGKNYFGGQDAAQEGLYQDKYGFLDGYVRFRRNQNTQSPIDASNTSIDLSKITRLTDGEPIDSFLPSTLSGNGGGRGGNSRVENLTDPAGGSPSSGGGGCMFVCDSFFFENSSVINLSGNPSNLGAVGIRSSMAWHAGSSGYGWPGVFICALKDRYAPEPFLYNLVVAKTGEWTPIVKSYSNDPLYPWGSGDYRKHTPGNTDYISSPPPAASQANKNFASEGGTAIKVIRFIQADDFVPAPGVDLVPRSLAPGLALQVAPNTPRTPGGDQSTITMTATANPSDSSYSYAKFEYRILGQSVWYPVSYKIKSEATITVASNGLSYEIKATAYGLDKRSGASTISTIAVGFVSQDPRYSSGGLPSAPEDIKVPAIKRLELINRLGNATDWDKFKSPDAEFKWAKTSVTAGGSIITTSGHRDLHLTGYKVRIFRTNGSILREEIVTDSYFIYSFEKNKKDTGGYPVREFKIDVQPVSSTGFTVTSTSITVSNPAPAAVSSPSAKQTKDGIDISYTLPSDADFVGVRIRDKVYTGSSVTIDPSTSRDEVLTITSVDQFGDGASVSVDAFNPEPLAVTNVECTQTKSGIDISFTPPTDVDYIGVKIRGVFYTGSSITIPPSLGREETLSIVSVDSFGDGESASCDAFNPAPDAVTNIELIFSLEGISVSFTPPDDVDLVGVRIRNEVYTGSSIMLSPSTVRDEVLTIVPVDGIGDGVATAIGAPNDLPPPPTEILHEAGITSAKVSFTQPDDFDLLGTAYRYRVENGTYNEYKTANSNEITLEGLTHGTRYQVELVSVDTLGPGNAVSIFLDTATIIASEIEGLGNWATAVDLVDLDFINANMDSNALPSTKIASLTASKITAGTLQATEYIQVGNTTDGGVLLTAGNGVDEGGYIQTIAPTVEGTSNYLMTMGPHIVGTDIYSLSASDGLTTPFFVNIDGSAKFGKLALSANGAISSDNFSISSTGAAEFTGSVTITGGSGIGSLTDAGALATADSVAYADTTGTKPPTDATNGAEWGSTLSGIPARISETASTGLNLTATYLGYYDGTNFQSYIDSSGNFHFGQAANNYIDFTGSKLVIDTDNFGLDAAGNASISGAITVQTGSNVTPGADVSTVSKIGCKVGYSTFTTTNAGSVFYHGFLSDASASNINPLIAVDGVPTSIDKGRLNTNLVTGVAYVVYESTLAQKYMSCVRSGGVWTKYYEGTKTDNYSILGTEIVIGLVDQRQAEVVLNAVVWGYGVSMESLPDTLSDTTEAALNTGTTTMGAGTLHLEGTDANIAIGDSTTFGTAGIQLQYNSGTPIAHIGSTTNYLQYNGSKVIVETDNFSIDSSGNATFSGGGSFTGVVTVTSGSNVEAGADVTQTALNGTTTMGAGTLHLSGTNANIAIGASTTWASSGIQLQYNSNNSATANPRAFIGSSVNYIKYEAGNLTIATDSIGAGATIGTSSVAFGKNAVADGVESVAMGYNADAGGEKSLSIGKDSDAAGLRSTSIGFNANASAQDSISIGTYSDGTGLYSTALGVNSNATDTGATALGNSADALDAYSIAIGYDATATVDGQNGIAIGAISEVSAYNAIAIGSSAAASFASSVAIGEGSATTAINQIRLGTSSETVSIPGDLDVDGNGSFAIIGASSYITCNGLYSTGGVSEFGTNLAGRYMLRAETTYSSIGSYAMLKSSSGGSSASPGDTFAGSTLRWSSAYNDTGASVLFGTWMCVGFAYYKDRATMYKRIS